MSNLNQNSKLYVLVIGSKGVNDYNLIQKKLDIYLSNYKESKNVELIGCDANGVDRFVEQYAKENGYTSKIFPISKEEWNEYKASAYWKKIKAMQEYIAEFDNRHCITFFDESSANAKHSLYNMCKLYNTHYVPVNITEDFTEELSFDTDDIEEYEEHVAHYGRVKKYVENPVVVRLVKQEELDRIDKILSKRHKFDNDSFLIEDIAQSVSEEDELLDSDTLYDFSSIEWAENERQARYKAIDEKLYIEKLKEEGKDYAGNVENTEELYLNLTAREQRILHNKDKKNYAKQYVELIRNSGEKAKKDFKKFYKEYKTKNIRLYDLIKQYQQLQDYYYNKYGTPYLYY